MNSAIFLNGDRQLGHEKFFFFSHVLIQLKQTENRDEDQKKWTERPSPFRMSMSILRIIIKYLICYSQENQAVELIVGVGRRWAGGGHAHTSGCSHQSCPALRQDHRDKWNMSMPHRHCPSQTNKSESPGCETDQCGPNGDDRTP